MFAALNSMHAAVAGRLREIATLRAIGFKPGVVLLSVLVEALALALLGGALGATLTWLALNGNEISTMGSGVSQVVFALRVDAATVAKGLFWALTIGLIGGLFPALTAARLPVVEALRQR
jgi:putative ABC transport system permease protein